MSSAPFETIEAIVKLNQKITSFWGAAAGLAPIEAAHLLSRSRLDWQVELSQMLTRWTSPPERSVEHAYLILAWANLGALVEGTLKWFLSVYYEDYHDDIDALKDKRGETVSPDGQTLEALRQFFRKRIWSEHDSWDAWVLKIQQRRNAIHAFKDRELGDHAEFLGDLQTYLRLVTELDRSVPYPYP